MEKNVRHLPVVSIVYGSAANSRLLPARRRAPRLQAVWRPCPSTSCSSPTHPPHQNTQIDDGNMAGMVSIRDVVHVMLKEHRWVPARGGVGTDGNDDGGIAGWCVKVAVAALACCAPRPTHTLFTPRPHLAASLPAGRRLSAWRSTFRAPIEQLPSVALTSGLLKQPHAPCAL